MTNPKEENTNNQGLNPSSNSNQETTGFLGIFSNAISCLGDTQYSHQVTEHEKIELWGEQSPSCVIS